MERSCPPPQGGRRNPVSSLMGGFALPALLLHRLGEPAGEREGHDTRQRAYGLEEALDLRREGDLVGLVPQLLQNLARAALLAHHVELLLGIVRGIERRIDE